MKPPPSAKPIKSILKRLGCIGLWVMNENGGLSVFDLSGNENTGTFSSSSEVNWTAGREGSAINFSGQNDSRISIPNSASIDIANTTNQCTINVKFKFDNTTGSLFGKEGAFSVYAIAGNFYFRIDKDTTELISTAPNETVNWHVAAWTVKGKSYGSEIIAYLDGVETGRDTTVQYDMIGGNSFALGHRIDGASTLELDGQESWCLLFNRALSDSEIAQLYFDPFFMFGRKRTIVTIPTLPPEVQALYMDLSTQIWTIKQSKGIFTKL